MVSGWAKVYGPVHLSRPVNQAGLRDVIDNYSVPGPRSKTPPRSSTRIRAVDASSQSALGVENNLHDARNSGPDTMSGRRGLR